MVQVKHNQLEWDELFLAIMYISGIIYEQIDINSFLLVWDPFSLKYIIRYKHNTFHKIHNWPSFFSTIVLDVMGILCSLILANPLL